MSDGTFLMIMSGVIMIEVLSIVYLKQRLNERQARPTDRKRQPERTERRRQKRTAGALRHRQDGSWSFR